MSIELKERKEEFLNADGSTFDVLSEDEEEKIPKKKRKCEKKVSPNVIALIERLERDLIFQIKKAGHLDKQLVSLEVTNRYTILDLNNSRLEVEKLNISKNTVEVQSRKYRNEMFVWRLVMLIYVLDYLIRVVVRIGDRWWMTNQ